ncbi:LOW QUALITY PROTEIN: cilia- and flagella-associated protein 61 [Boleophthalmus pectinirostris]|uniref:LOW QUALITY PROTEIN: cilia- and flagella-associated protein 61 n=1 Tax=Boleophthalmus pectinirostris TaxID=150288 RepID=UPI00242CC674|nr:LOW QUALITY PROTEIN: cilia- and flagella-associated protein 61 [Boleophthalmus pectinirostris]
MRVLSSSRGELQTVWVRRSESSDAENINSLLQQNRASVFGRVNVLHLLEKSNLAVSLLSDRDELLAHASFSDQPIGGLVDPAEWEPFVRRISGSDKYKPENTLFLHLFVSEPTFAAATSLEIMRAVFSAVPELQFVLLLSPHVQDLDPVLVDLFEPLESQTQLTCVAQVCVRDQHCPKLNVRQARVEDHDDVMKIFAEETKLQTFMDKPFFMANVIEMQSELRHSAVCEGNGEVVGFISVTADARVKSLLELYDLSEFEGVFPDERSQSEDREAGGGQSEETESETGQSENREEEKDQSRETDGKTGQSEERETQTGQSENREKEKDQSETREAEKGQSNTPKTQEPAQTEEKTDQSGPALRRRSEAQPDQSEDRKETGPASSEQKEEKKEKERKEEEEEEEEERREEEEAFNSHRAFLIQLFAIDKNHEPRSVDFLPYLFALFPERDLCVVTVATLQTETPLIHNFTRISPRNTTPPPHAPEMYALHRSALRSVQVRRSVPSDRKLILDLVRGLDHGDVLLQDLDQFYQTETDQVGVPVQCFVAQVGTQLVGVVLVRDEQEVEFLRAHYNIENFIYFSHHSYEEHAALRHFVLRPTARHCCHLLFREVLRLSHKSCLYHRDYPPHSPHRQTSCINPLDFLLDCAVPVRPRPQMDFNLEDLGVNAPSSQITDPQAPFALLLISRKLTLEQKVVVNARITVCGASDTGLSLLETLCCCPHLRFNRLTLVSTHGLHGDAEDDTQFLSTSHVFSRRDVELVPLSSVKTLRGKVVSIDRKSKHVQVSSHRKSSPVPGSPAPPAVWLPYDILILCTGLQYQAPSLIGSGPVPLNLWTLEEPEDRAKARLWVQEQLGHGHGTRTRTRSSVGLRSDEGRVSSENIVVYGHDIDAFTSVQTFLSLGLPGPQIHLVLAPSESGSWLPDPDVERAVDLNLEKVQVQVYKNCVLQNISTEENRVTSVTFNYNGENVQICCGALVSVSCRGLDPGMRRSLLDSFLVLDERLVIDRCFQTNDPWILSAGTTTKFSRTYHSDEWNHQRFCSREVGQDLARQILLLFDVTAEPREESELLPIYKRPKVTGGILPGELHFLHVTKPTPTTRSKVPYLKESSLVTGRADVGSFFRLQLGDEEQVETFTCASSKPLPLHNLLCLYGQQQSLLGNLSTRFRLGQVPDLYRFFRQSWCWAVFHDRFRDFQLELRAMANHSATDAEVRAPEKKGEDQTSTGGEEKKEERKERPGPESTELLDPETRAAVRSAVVKYLSYNRNLLPMYAQPGEL